MKNKGFTLVELLVVIVIIGILAAAAISVFGGGTDKAKLNTMKSDVAAMVSAGSLYLADQGWDGGNAADVTLVNQNGYLGSIPKNPFLSSNEDSTFYAYAGTQMTVGVNTNPAVYAAGIEIDSTLFEKGPSVLAISATDGTTWTGGPQGTGQVWTVADPAAN